MDEQRPKFAIFQMFATIINNKWIYCCYKTLEMACFYSYIFCIHTHTRLFLLLDI